MSFVLNLYTPNGTVVKNLECNDILIPSVRGEINILPDHTHLLTELSTGKMTVKTKGKERHFSVTAGVFKVLKNVVSVLSITSEQAEDIDIERAEQAKKKAEEKLSGKDSLSDADLIKYRRKLERAELRLQLGYLRTSPADN